MSQKHDTASNFKFARGQKVSVVVNGNRVHEGPVISRCDYDRAENTYEIRFVNAQGNVTQKFFTESALVAE